MAGCANETPGLPALGDVVGLMRLHKQSAECLRHKDVPEAWHIIAKSRPRYHRIEATAPLGPLCFAGTRDPVGSTATKTPSL